MERAKQTRGAVADSAQPRAQQARNFFDGFKIGLVEKVTPEAFEHYRHDPSEATGIWRCE